MATTHYFFSRGIAPRPETVLLVALCCLDLLTSVWLFANGLAVESNPLMRPFAEAGPAAFTLAKLLSFVPAVCYLEWLRWHRPAFAVGLLRFGSAGYTGLYAVPAMIQFLS